MPQIEPQTRMPIEEANLGSEHHRSNLRATRWINNAGSAAFFLFVAMTLRPRGVRRGRRTPAWNKLPSPDLMLPLPPTRLLPYPSVGASSSPCGRAKNLDVAAFFLARHMKLLSASHQSSASGIADIPFKHKLIMLRSQDSGMPTISTTIIA